jgi:predicted permease
MIQDLREGVRMLTRHPRSSLLIAGLLAVGIGASTAVFSLFDAILLRPLPVRHPEQLVSMVQYISKLGARDLFPFPYYEALRDQAKSLAVTFGDTGQAFRDFVMADPGPAQDVDLDAVTSQFFQALGVPALYGRALLPSDEKAEPGSRPAVLSYSFWKRRFGGDPRVVNDQTVVINKHHFAIVGVMPRDFHGLTVDTTPDLWVPMRTLPPLVGGVAGTNRMPVELAGRLKPGVTLLQAQAECRTIWQSAMKDYYQSVGKLPSQEARELFRLGVALQPLARGTSILRAQFGGVLELLLASVGVLLLIVCSNVAGLLLARAAARQQEFAVRLAVGATRLRLVRHLLAEGFLLAILGAAGGLLIALAAMPLALRMLPPMRDFDTSLVPLSLNAGINGRVFLFLLAVSALTMLLFSLSPAIAVSRSNIESLLRAARASAGVRGRQALITLQIALCTFLLALAGLFVRTFQQLREVNPGIDVDHIATFTGNLTGYSGGPAFLKTLTERVRQIPDVILAAVSSFGVMREHGEFATVEPAGQLITRADFLNVALNDVSPGYFKTMGMRVLFGRGLVPSDVPAGRAASPTMALVNQKFARRFFPDTNPVGKLFGWGTVGIAKGDFEIVGIVSDARYRSLREPIFPMVYTAKTQFKTFVLNVRTHESSQAIIEPVCKVWQSLGPGAPFLEVDTLAQEVDQTTASERVTATLALLFGAVAALLAGVGIYGLLACLVTERQREIGIRMALGARPVDIGKLIALQTVAMTATGIILGLAGALIAGPAIRFLLYGISPQDPKSLFFAILFVALTAGVATLFPVLRAIRSEPSETLRQEN